jgi:hypothetical protein
MMGRFEQKWRTSEIHCKKEAKGAQMLVSVVYSGRRAAVHGQSGCETDLLLDVVERVGRVDREADEDDVRVRVRQRPQAVVVLLASGIPEGKLDLLAINLDVWVEEGLSLSVRAASLIAQAPDAEDEPAT